MFLIYSYFLNQFQLRCSYNVCSYKEKVYYYYPLKCCVPRTNSNYKSTKSTVSVNKFPKDPGELKRWVASIPRSNLSFTKYSVVCRHPKPNDIEFVSNHGNLQPVGAPSAFPGIPKGCLISLPAKLWQPLASSSSRGIIPVEVIEFSIASLVSYLIEMLPSFTKVITTIYLS